MKVYENSKFFCSLLPPNWEVSTACFLYSFINSAQSTQKNVLSLYIEDSETNLPIGKPTLRVFT